MKTLFRAKMGLTIVVLALLVFAGCAKTVPATSADVFPVYASYREIPGVTQEEIDAIESFQVRNRVFVYGMVQSAEAFPDKNGVGGFSSLVCDALSDLFGIRFVPTIYEWNVLLEGLLSGKIDFSGDLNVSPERMQRFYMTDAIVQRSMKIAHLPSYEISDYQWDSEPRYGFLDGSITLSLVSPHIPYRFEPVALSTINEAYQAIKNGEIDVFFDETAEASFEGYTNIVIEDFSPLVYYPVAISTGNPELQPFISVIEKYLKQGANYQMTKMYKQGYLDYLRYSFTKSLTPEELTYVSNHKGKTIQIALEKDNYPISFFNSQENEWQGIANDVLKEIENITGLHFEAWNDENIPWAVNLATLENGAVPMISQLILTDERGSRFLFGETYSRDKYALLSRNDYENIGINDVFYTRVGLIRATAYTEVFNQWFPNHLNTVEYDNIDETLAALESGKVDLVMGTQNMLLTFTNYLEQPEFKANLVFNRVFESRFGFNLGEQTLWSVINKAQLLVDTETITNHWVFRAFDYRNRLIRSQRPYFIGISVSLVLVLLLVVLLLLKYRQTGKQLEVMVSDRTAELEVQSRAAQDAFKAKSRFFSNMSHELRTPLNAIIGLSELEMRKTSDTESSGNLEEILNSGSVLLNIISDMLDMSKIESDKMELLPVDYLLPEVLNSVISQNMVRIGDKPIHFVLDINENVPSKLYGDSLRIKQIMNNLLSNAVKYTKEGKVTLIVSSEPSGGENVLLKFSVEDTGIGIEAEDMPKLFTDYNQIDSGANRSTDGTGLGLSISKRLAEMMDGTIFAESEFGRGSVFTVSIVQKVIDETPIGKTSDVESYILGMKRPSSSTATERLPMPGAQILIVDDVLTNLAVAKGLMKPYGMIIDTVTSGQEAVALVRDEKVKYDAIFMDHMMPGMDGIEAVRIIREEIGSEYAKTIPIVALTANVLTGNDAMFLANGFQAYLAKPIDIQKLDEILNVWVRSRGRIASPEELEKMIDAMLIPPEQDEAAKEQAIAIRILSRPVSGVDLKQGIDQFGAATYLDVLGIFVSDTPALLDQIMFVTQESLAEYAITIRGIKGAAYGISANVLGHLGEELENAALAHSFDLVQEHNRVFIGAAQRVIEKLKLIVELDAV
ncbi:hypothetical protein FACS1894151_05370 [Spirochaetia bacterium]|nr:hypothetical protein FACS1894151_05370 [Spirochaetia bacterium]